MSAAYGGQKRFREDDEESLKDQNDLFGKRARPTTEPEGERDKRLSHDSVLDQSSSQAREQPNYDSDDGQSSMVSEPDSPQDISMSSDDETEDNLMSRSPERGLRRQPRASALSSPWGQRLRTDRVPTPVVAMRPGARATRPRTGIKQHIRQRHPQENNADHLEVPSPIDEDEVPTPPSAAEAAGCQLSMLTVSDVDMEESDAIPTISIEPARPSNLVSHTNNPMANTVSADPMDSGPDSLVVSKQRQRSDALSSGTSPIRAGSSNSANIRGFSVGFRADCEKCRMRVPGHMNHFVS